MTDITLAQITNATTGDDGTGAFDVLMQVMELHLEEQYADGRITGSDYANVYLGGLQEVLKTSIGYVLQQEEAGFKGDAAAEQVLKIQAETDLVQGQVAKVYSEIALTDQKQITELAQTTDPSGGLLKGKLDLIAAQTLGFASDTKQKILKQMLEGYAVTLSIAGVATQPSTVDESAIDQLSQEILTDIGSSVDIQSSVQVPEVGV